MSLVKRNVIFPKGTTDGFQLIPQPARAPLGGVADPEKGDDAVPDDYMKAWVAAHSGGTSVTYDVSIPPNNASGNNGDWKINTSFLYYKTGGVWVQISTMNESFSYINPNRFFNYAGDPRLILDGEIGDYLFDTTNNNIYYCSTANTIIAPGSSDAVWDLILQTGWPIIITQDDAINLAIDQLIKLGQRYIINSIGTSLPTGIKFIRTEGVYNGSNIVFDECSEVFLEGFANYIPCKLKIDKGLFTINIDEIVWSGFMSQTGTDAPTEDAVILNLLGENITWEYYGVGEYKGTVTNNQFIDTESVIVSQDPINLSVIGKYVIVGPESSSRVLLYSSSGATKANSLLTRTFVNIRLVHLFI
jgi:hypothetical protein